MRQRFRFISGEVRLIIPSSVEFVANSLADAEGYLIEWLRTNGEVDKFSALSVPDREPVKDVQRA